MTAGNKSDQPTPGGARLRITFVLFALSLVLLITAVIYSAWRSNSEREANMPVPATEMIVLALRTFHHQTGRFPHDFRELDRRVWEGARANQISPDGTVLVASSSRYFYTLHTINPPQPARATVPAKAGIWAVPTGERAHEAATYFWYVTPQRIEGWMGPALTHESIGMVREVPSEQQLTLLAMTRQLPGSMQAVSAPKGIFSPPGF